MEDETDARAGAFVCDFHKTRAVYEKHPYGYGRARRLVVRPAIGPLGDSVVVAVRKNGANTAMTVTVPAGGGGQIMDLVNEVDFQVGDEISVGAAHGAGLIQGIVAPIVTIEYLAGSN